jgi:hypothetical protein
VCLLGAHTHKIDGSNSGARTMIPTHTQKANSTVQFAMPAPPDPHTHTPNEKETTLVRTHNSSQGFKFDRTRSNGGELPLTTLDEVEAFMFAYRELHLPGKQYALQALYRLYKEIRNNDLWLATDELRKNKDQVLASIAMQVISACMMAIEDFVKMSYCMSRDILEIPNSMASYIDLNDILEYFEKSIGAQGIKTFANVLHCADRDDLARSEFDFLTAQDKDIIVRQHDQNAKAVAHTYSYTTRVYETFRKPYNKHKHGYLFLFSMGFAQSTAPPPFDKLSPAIPYFADEKNLNVAEPVFVGEVVLDKLALLLFGGGGIFSILRDYTNNLTARCKYGGRKIITRAGLGPEVLSQGERVRFEELIREFDSRFVKDPAPRKLDLKMASNIKQKDWEYFGQDWGLK